MNNRAHDLYLFGPYPPPYGGVSIFMDQLTSVLYQHNIPHILKRYHGSTGVLGEVIPTAQSVIKHFWRMSPTTICLDSCTFFIEYPSRRVLRAWLALKSLRRFRWIKIIHEGRLPTRYRTLPSNLSALTVRGIQHVDEFIVVNEDIGYWLQNEMNVRQPVHHIPSLLPLTLGDNIALPQSFEQARRTYDKIICSIGVFDANYGFAHIADAVEILRAKSDINIGLVFVDGKFARDEDYKADVIRNRDWITVLDEIPHPQTLSLLANSDVYVRGVKRESFGISKIEALWVKIPVISTKTGETRGMQLYDFDDEAQLVKQIRVALSNGPSDEANQWREFFTASAQDNLAEILKVIGR